MRSAALALVLGVVCLPGCELALLGALGDDEPDETLAPPYTYEGQGAIDIRSARLSGTMGHVDGFEGGIWLEQGFDYGGQSSVEIQSRDASANWAVMTMVTVEGGLAHESLTPGASLSFDGGYATSGRPMFISVLGCAGSADGGWDFDSTADHVDVQVRQGSEPGTQVLDYAATWYDPTDYSGHRLGRQTVTGSFEYRIPTTDAGGTTAPPAI